MKLPARLARSLRKLLGPDPELVKKLLAAQQEATRERTHAQEMIEKRVAAGKKADQRQIEIDRLRAKLTKAMNTEPGPAEGCIKVRLRHADEAWEFARRVAEDTGTDLAAFKVYPCPICPRQPVGVSRFYHITNSQNDDQRSNARKRNAGKKNANGTALGARIDPAALARLKGE